MIRFNLATAWQVMLVVVTALLALAISALVGPAVFDVVEKVAHPLTFEFALRGYMLIAGTLWLLGFTALTLGRPRPASVSAWLWTALVAAAVAVVFALDRHNPVSDEFSWIRYTTAACLFAVAALAVPIVRSYRERAERPFRITWIVVALGSVFLALDELCEIHEIIGTRIQRHFGLPHAFIDWLTLGYAAIGLALALWIGPRVLRTYTRDHAPAMRLFVVGAVLFLSAQVLDSTDRFFHPFMSGLAGRLSADPHRVFSDVWYFFWQPRVNFNSIEEVLENISAGLFAAATMLILVDRGGLRLPAALLRPRRGAATALWATLAIAVVGLLVWARPTEWIPSPIPGVEAHRVIGPEHGLMHADAGAYAPEWGVMVANEGEGGVLSYHDGKVRVFPDPADSTAELDAVGADDDAIYASLPGLHEIERFTDADGWQPVATEADGLDAPEGLVVVDSTVYAVDETSHRLYAVDMRTHRVAITPLDDKRIRYPEGIAWQPQLGELIITDDKSGYVMAMTPAGAMRTFAGPKQGLKQPEDVAVADDGNVFVTDPPHREVIEFDPEGKVLGRLRFTRMYGDVVGINVVGSGAARVVYVVTADASHNDAFVPSGLWEIPLPGHAALP